MRIILLLLNITLLFGSADRALLIKKMKEEQRVALVIGNNNYEHLSKLKNPINDARAMKSILQLRGFKVLYQENASKRDMKKLIEQFSDMLEKGGVGLYYFAGHGINVEGNNYLAAINSDFQSKEDVEFEAYALNRIIRKLQNAHNRLNIVILDACRNDPFARGESGGLAPIGDAKGIFVAYATQAGNVALDGERANGVFTKNLIKNMQIPGDTIEKVFKNTRDDVQKETHGKQSPGVYNQITGDFYFTFDDNSNFKTPAPIIQPEKVHFDDLEDIEFWNYVKSENTIAYYKAYMKKYPDGTFVDVAQEKIASLEKAKEEAKENALKALIEERDRAHLGLGVGFLGAEGWIRKKHFDYGSSIKATPDTDTLEITAFVNYHPSLEKNGIYGNFSFGYHHIKKNDETDIVPGVGLGVGFRSVFYDLLYIDYGVKVLFNEIETDATFNAFSGLEF